MDIRQWHYVKHNQTSRLPRRHIYLDTEAITTRTRAGHSQSWRLAVATFTAAEKGRRATESTATFTTPADLWRAVAAHCRKRSRTILWAHNLGYDVRIAEAFTELPAQGWELVGHNLASRGAWLQWRRDDTSLVMVDSASVFPTTLAHLAPHFGLTKPDLPADADTFATWQRRCAADVTILRRAVESYLDWLETADLGNWQMTGAGQSYAAFRHRFMAHELLVHGDGEALAAERRAMWTGRCEAYWHGRTGLTGVEEWDMTTAYARIARDHAMPVRLRGRLANPARWETLLGNPQIALLAEVDVRTNLPLLPTAHDGRIIWPVGEFSTTLWDPEVRLALARGAHLTPRRVWVYQRQPALAAWGAWILDLLDPANPATAPWQKIVLKHWSRALIGRFAMSYTAWGKLGAVEDLGVRHCPMLDIGTGVETTLTQVGREVFVAGGQQEWDQSMPAITGYVASLARCQLWRLTEMLGPRVALYVDTDSILVRAKHHDTVAKVATVMPEVALRLKSTWRGATITGPRQIITDDRVRVSGVPVKASRLPDGRLSGEVWASLHASLRSGRPNVVDIRSRKWTLRGVDRRRAEGPDGWTVPVHISEGITT